MLYRAIGLMSGSSLDGLDIAFTEFHEMAGNGPTKSGKPTAILTARIGPNASCAIVQLSVPAITCFCIANMAIIWDRQVNRFIEENGLQYKVALIASHGHTTFHVPAQKMTAQLGDGAALLPRHLACGHRSPGTGCGSWWPGGAYCTYRRRLLLPGYDYFLNLGGIANIP
jgi:anhydro-N-acetylmuramic acid kinase